MWCRISIVVFLIVICPQTATGADEPLNFEMTPLAGYRFGGTFDVQNSDDSYEMQDSSSFGFILNLRDRAYTQWEIIYSQQSSSVDLVTTTQQQANFDVDIHVLQIGGTYQGSGEKVRPYVAATLGGTRISAESESDHFFSGSIGLGVQFLPTSRVGIRVEARAYGTLTDSSTDLFCRTGPNANLCAVRVEGEFFGQFETFAGVVFRF